MLRSTSTSAKPFSAVKMKVSLTASLPSLVWKAVSVQFRIDALFGLNLGGLNVDATSTTTADFTLTALLS